MTRDEMQKVMDAVFNGCRELRAAHRDDNAFANFERIAERFGLLREAVLLVCLEKHLDGIYSWVKGHRSQRDVRGRIKDAIVYLCLLHGMVDETTAAEATEAAEAAAKAVKRVVVR